MNPISKIRNGILLLIMVLAPLSCKKIRQLPPEPVISFTGFSMFDSTDILGNTHKAGILEFYFEDGDGDIGLEQPYFGDSDTDTTNLTFYLYEKENGFFTTPSDTLGYRIPYIERIGQNQTLQGTIEITFLYIGFSESDTLFYEFFIKDRAGNISNTSESYEIIFTGAGGCIGEEEEA
jgi:hypothetical protein